MPLIRGRDGEADPPSRRSRIVDHVCQPGAGVLRRDRHGIDGVRPRATDRRRQFREIRMSATTQPFRAFITAQHWESRMLGVLRIVVSLLFMEHGTSKLFGFPAPPHGGEPHVLSLFWFAGILEVFGGLLVAIGLFTRPVALLLFGEMAIGYWMIDAPRNFFPLLNGGDAAVLYCFVFLYLFVAGGGAWSLDRLRGS
jgi:putative oxidoreductase